jgi:hypothetical protein
VQVLVRQVRRFVGTKIGEVHKLRELEQVNARLKKLLADRYPKSLDLIQKRAH